MMKLSIFAQSPWAGMTRFQKMAFAAAAAFFAAVLAFRALIQILFYGRCKTVPQLKLKKGD